MHVQVTGEGDVRSDPAGIDCGQTCDATFATGVSARLVATPRAGSRFDGWSGECTGSGDCALQGATNASHVAHVSATFVAVPPPPPPPPPDECAGLMPSSLPTPVTALLPNKDCFSGSTSDGEGNFALGFDGLEPPDVSSIAYIFFSITNGAAARVGTGKLEGSDEGIAGVFGGPSGFTGFETDASTGWAVLAFFTHDGTRIGQLQMSNGGFNGSALMGRAFRDPAGGAAVLREYRDSTGALFSTYQRFGAGGGPETSEVRLDRRLNLAGVDLDGNTLLISGSQGRWLRRDATSMTGWFDLPAGPHFLDPVVEGGLAVRTGGVYTGLVPDGETRQTALPGWLEARAAGSFASIRGGKAYASWGSGSTCGASSIEVVVPSSGKSCGCLSVPDFAPTGMLSSFAPSGTVGVDGSVIVPQHAPRNGKCAYSLYPQLLR